MCSWTLTELGDSVGAKEHPWRDIAVPADQWQEVLSSARAHHAAGTLFRTKDTVVTVEADEEDVSLLEEEGEEGKDDDYQEEFPAPSVQAAPQPTGPSRSASVLDRLSHLMAINLVSGNGSLTSCDGLRVDKKKSKRTASHTISG